MTQDLITEVATKSNGDDSADIDVIILVTSLTVNETRSSTVAERPRDASCH